MKAIEISLNGKYLATTKKSKTCKEAVQKVWELSRNLGLFVAGKGEIEIKETDKITARFKAAK